MALNNEQWTAVWKRQKCLHVYETVPHLGLIWNKSQIWSAIIFLIYSRTHCKIFVLMCSAGGITKYYILQP